MNDHEPITDLVVIAEQAFTEATEAHLLTEENRDDIHDTFDDLIGRAVGEGEIIVTGRTVTRLIRDHLWMVVNNRAGRRTQTTLKALWLGQATIPGTTPDELLDLVLTVGDSRRSTLRHLTSADVQRMVDARAKNLEKQAAAFEEFQLIASWVLGLLAEFSTIPAALAAGALAIGEEKSA